MYFGLLAYVYTLVMLFQRISSFRHLTPSSFRRFASAPFLQAISCQKKDIPTDDAMEELGAALASQILPGDVILLRGDLGAGKSTFSRGFVRTKCNEPDLLVTSPSYLLDNCYEYEPSLHIHHMDLYRLPTGCDLNFLSIPEVFKTSICLIEWPERLGDNKPTEFIDMNIKINQDESRTATITFVGEKWFPRLKALETAVDNSS